MTFLPVKKLTNSLLEVLIGDKVGFEKEAALGAKYAGEFLKRSRET